MPLSASSTETAVVSAVGVVIADTNAAKDLESFHAGELWSKVATAFFGTCVNPKWAEFEAAEAAFADSAGKSIDEASFGAAWSAYVTASLASLIVGPPYVNGDTPTVPGAYVPPGPPAFPATMASAASENHEVAAKNLYADLKVWAATGTEAALTPTTPPLPVLHPWD